MARYEDDGRESSGFGKIIGGVIAGVAVLVVLTTALSTYYTVDQGERGVILCNGAICGDAEPGLHFKMPFVQHVALISVQSKKDGFEKVGETDGRMSAYSRDQQPATISLAVNYHVIDPAIVYAKYGSTDNMETRLIDPRAYELVKNVFGQFNAVEAIQDRAKLNAEVYEAIRKAVTGPVTIDGVQIEDITFSDKYETAVENRMEATVKQQQAEAEKQQRITSADAAAYEVKANADAQAHSVEVQGRAQAEAIKARGDALRDNPNLVALTTAEKWNGELPSTMVSGGTVPLLSLKGQ
jgi:regulator of protease activity HflC (stomatin/prohibitin superfamily)